LLEVVGEVGAKDHLGDGLAHVPVLSLRKQLKDVILWVQQQFERNSTVMVLKHRFIVVAESFGVPHRYQERVIDTTIQKRFKTLRGA
jgi:hypothetical protein